MNVHSIVTRVLNLQQLTFARSLTVLSWGRNAEGQCGVERTAVVVRPTAILELYGSHVNLLEAGIRSSCAVSLCGDVWTWGCGEAGKLGHGSADMVHAPARVESLIGRAHIMGASLGEMHTVFLDSTGSVWSCGENREGQCGLGTPLQVIAQQHRQAFFQAAGRTAAHPSYLNHQHRPAHAMHGYHHNKGSPSLEDRTKQYLRSLLQASPPPPSGAALPRVAGGMRPSASGGGSHMGAGTLSHGSGGADLGMALGFGGFDVQTHFDSTGMQPGHQHVPTRLGRDLHPLMASAFSGAYNDAGAEGTTPVGLARERVVAVEASRHFSLALTDKGEVWTFGSCFNGCLGSDASFSSSAALVGEPLASVLAQHGGAVAIAAAGAFCMALTQAGKVVVWGKVPEGMGMPAAGGPGNRALEFGAMKGHRVVAGVIPNLPTIKTIAAGQQHGLLSDGCRVWALGRWVGRLGALAGSAAWHEPQLVADIPAGVSSLSAGLRSSAAVTPDGQVYMWGHILDPQHAANLMTQHGDGSSIVEDAQWGWAGFGSDEPTLVDGLHDVTGVRMGGWHALALVE